MIELMQVTIYPRGPGNYHHSDFKNPIWELVDAHLSTMDAFEKPILSLLQDASNPGTDMMMVCGGDSIFHIQTADSRGFWSQAFDPRGSEEIVAVWTSDQGFDTEKKYTWSLDTTRSIVHYYLEHAKPHPVYNWE